MSSFKTTGFLTEWRLLRASKAPKGWGYPIRKSHYQCRRSIPPAPQILHRKHPRGCCENRCIFNLRDVSAVRLKAGRCTLRNRSGGGGWIFACRGWKRTGTLSTRHSSVARILTHRGWRRRRRRKRSGSSLKGLWGLNWSAKKTSENSPTNLHRNLGTRFRFLQ